MTTPRIDSLNQNDDQIGMEAGEWVARLTDTPLQTGDMNVSAGEPNEAFFEWMSRSSKHRETFMNTFETYCRLGHIDTQRRIDVAALAAKTGDDSVPIRQESLTGASIFVRRYRRHWAVAAALAILAMGGGYWGFEVWRVMAPQPMTYSTAVGERRHLTLEDGSIVILNTASRIEVLLTRDDRQVRLVAGEIFLNVRHDIHRPFVVTSDDVRIVDVGTQFDVYRRSSGIKVSVLEGSIKLNCACFVATDLSRGDRAEIVVEGNTTNLHRTTPSVAELQRALAWREGALSFTGAPLSEVVGEFNRYNAVQLVIADPSIAGQLIGGYFPSPNPDELIRTLRSQGMMIDAEVDPAAPTRIRLVRRQRPDDRSGRSAPDVAIATKPRRGH